MSKIKRFRVELFRNFAKKTVRETYETLLVALPEPMSFLIIGNIANIREGSQFETMLSKIRKIRKFRHLRCQKRGSFPHFFPQLCFEYPTVSKFRSIG